MQHKLTPSQTRVVVNYTNNENAYGRATKTHGRRSEIKLKHKGGGDRTIASISVIGAQARTNAERARDEFVLDVCCGRKPGLQSFAFIRHMFFPVAEELAGEAPASLRRREIYGLNLSQSEVVAGMVHSPRPCTVVHGEFGCMECGVMLIFWGRTAGYGDDEDDLGRGGGVGEAWEADVGGRALECRGQEHRGRRRTARRRL